MSTSIVSFICLETSHSSSRSLRSDKQHDSIPLGMVDGHHRFTSGTSIHPPEPNTFLFTDAKIGLAYENRLGFGSICSEFHFPNAQLPKCGFVCDTIQSQTPFVCISSSEQSCLSDRCIVNGLESSSCICIPTDNSDTICTCQDSTISVQNSSYCSFLTPTFMVFKGVTTISISSNLSSALSKTADTSKRKVSTSKSPITHSLRLGVIKQSIRDKKFTQSIADFVSK